MHTPTHILAHRADNRLQIPNLVGNKDFDNPTSKVWWEWSPCGNGQAEVEEEIL